MVAMVREKGFSDGSGEFGKDLKSQELEINGHQWLLIVSRKYAYTCCVRGKEILPGKIIHVQSINLTSHWGLLLKEKVYSQRKQILSSCL